MMTKQLQEFNYYCLDRISFLSNDLRIAYIVDGVIRKLRFKIGLRAKIKRRECFILYTETEEDLDQFMYIDVDSYFDNERRFFTDIFSVEEKKEIIKQLNTINIFEFLSMLNFISIDKDFYCLVENNWTNLDMDNLIEL